MDLLVFVSPIPGQSAARRAEEGVVTDPPFPGSWTLFKSQDRLRPRGLTSRPETVLALEGPRSRESGDPLSLSWPHFYPVMWKTVPEGRTSKTRSIFLPGARDYGILNPYGVQDSVNSLAPGKMDLLIFVSPFRTKCNQESRRGSSYRSPIPWILDPLQEPRPSPAARADLAAGRSLGS